MSSNEITTVFTVKFDNDDCEIELTPETTNESGYQHEFYNSIVESSPKPDEASKTGPTQNTCLKCGKTYKYLTLFQKHAKMCTGGTMSPRGSLHICSHCQKVYKNRTSYEKHALFCAESQTTPCLLDRSRCFCCAEPASQAHNGHIPCDHCPKKFKTKEGLARHGLLLHAQTTNFRCELCTVQCSNNYILKLHRESHKQEFERIERSYPEYKCDACGKFFLDATATEIHLSCHKRDKVPATISYYCKLCGEAFTVIERFYNHLCEGVQTNKFKCELCGKCLATMGFYRRHINVHRKYNGMAESVYSEYTKKQQTQSSIEESEKSEMIEIDAAGESGDESNDQSPPDSKMDIKEEVMSIFDNEPPSKKVRILNDGNSGRVPPPRILNSKAVQPIRVLNGTPEMRQLTKPETNNNNSNNNNKLNTKPTTTSPKPAHLDRERTNSSTTPPNEVDFETIIKNIKQDRVSSEDFFPMDITTLRESVTSLLKIMLDTELLDEFGFNRNLVDLVLSRLLEKMEFEPYTDSKDVGVQLRENVKLLLKSMCDDTSAIRNIENIHTVDAILRELIKHSS